MKPGIYTGLPNAEYHAGPGVSKSMLDVLANRSPLHLQHLRTAANDNERQPTPAQMVGTAFHALILEPAEFAKDYCLALRQQDVPEAIEDRDQLVAMVQELNATRLPKLATGGTKDELVARIKEALGDDENAKVIYLDVTAEKQDTGSVFVLDILEDMKLAELKAEIARLNESRPGLLSTSGNRHELAELLRANGKPVTLWSDVKAEWEANNSQRIVLTQEQWDQLHSMRDAVMAHPAARALLSVPGWAELSAYWNDERTGELCRCRPDYWRQDGLLVDVKTTEDASPEAFARSIAGWRYHVQHPFYVDGVTQALTQASERNLRSAFNGKTPPLPKAFVFLAVEKTACVVNGQAKGVAVYVLDGESVELGRALYQADLAMFAQCNRTGIWPGYGDKIQPIKVPAYEFTRNAHLLNAA